ncbi:MAG: glutathione S-transferase family protein [Pseudomonadota bacterium]
MRKALAVLLTPVLLLLLPALVGLIIWRGRSYQRRAGRQPYTVPHQAQLELYYTPLSLCSSKALLCLIESRLAFRGVELDIGHFGRFEQLSDQFLRMNPNACVPVLVHAGHPVLESHDIIEYLSAQPGAGQLLPQDHEGLASMRYWSNTGSFVDMNSPVSEQLGAAIALLSSPLFAIDEYYMQLGTLLRALPRHPQPKLVLLKIANWFFGPQRPPQPMLREAVAALEDGLAAMARQLADGRLWLAGDGYSLADVTWTANFARLHLLGTLDHFLAPHPALRAYWQRLRDRPSYEQVFVEPLNRTAQMQRLQNVAAAAQRRCQTEGVMGAYGL